MAKALKLEKWMDGTDYRIITTAKYGEHIELRCKNHKDLRWSTKNIDHIGARSIFFSSNWTEGDGTYHEECDCPFNKLEVVDKKNLVK